MGIAWRGDDTDAVIRDAKVADDAGVEALLVAETWGHDGFTILSLIARETKRVSH